MKVVSFNANGIRSAAKKGFFDWLKTNDPDVVCIQETKVQHHILDAKPFFPEGYYCHYVDVQKPGYSGVAIYAKHQPKNIITSMGYPIADDEGRYLQFDYEDLSIVSMYLPSGTSGAHRQAVKFDFLDALGNHFEKLKSHAKHLILCGDYNIAHKEIDLKNWKSNQKNSGFLPEERAWMDNLFGEMRFYDAFRLHNQEPLQYTWWSNRGQAYAKNVGWRIDYQVISEALANKIKAASIYKDVRFSDHAPLIIEYDGEHLV